MPKIGKKRNNKMPKNNMIISKSCKDNLWRMALRWMKLMSTFLD